MDMTWHRLTTPDGATFIGTGDHETGAELVVTPPDDTGRWSATVTIPILGRRTQILFSASGFPMQRDAKEWAEWRLEHREDRITWSNPEVTETVAYLEYGVPTLGMVTGPRP
jgi:hypothetical protein